MEYVKGISLRDYYQRCHRRICEKACKRIFYQLCDAMSYLHSNHMAHRDIKLENILINGNNDIKIIDFGFGMISPENETQHFFCGTPNYIPPDIAVKVGYKGDKADLWSLGILLYKMIVGDFPFKGKSEKDLYKSIKTGKFIFPHDISDDAKKVICNLIVLKPEKRVSCEKILKFDWLKRNKEEKEQISVRVVKFDKENKNLIEALKFLNYNKKKEDN